MLNKVSCMHIDRFNLFSTYGTMKVYCFLCPNHNPQILRRTFLYDRNNAVRVLRVLLTIEPDECNKYVMHNNQLNMIRSSN